MRLTTMLLLFSMLSFWAQAQSTDSIVYSIIEENIQVDSSSLYYPLLLERYEDSTEFLTSEERFHLYYGSIFQDNYSPITPHALMDSIENEMIFEEGQSMDHKHLKLLCQQVLEDEPLNIGVLKKLKFAFLALDEIEESEKCHSKIKILLSSMLQSKNVEDGKTSYMVVQTADIFHLIEEQPWTTLGEVMIMGREESVKLDVKGEEKWLYFNIGPSLDYLSSM